MDPHPAIIIRPVVAQDRAQWQPLWDAYNAFYGRSGPTALAADITDLTWSRMLDEAEPVHALVAERHGQLLGLAHFLYHRNTIMAAPVCYLQDLFTLPAVRGQGIARALIEALYRRAADDGAARVYWHTHHTNAGARQLYDKLADDSGFIVYRKSLD
ncbi:GNAT family N-acetyltransferase [Herbaspirillum sp. YR522]|uniref:GNAT family N-acetyltransferase n=1 Tax=Herbaspirillum sp. YR522 TaxID=1144342 RepID=UPI00026F6DAA|nr:GNAT family N-acetyltransferase [Herbaspirillum sp. YR522]EJN08189.1 acetyltransferase [Herbaspirillum sp. YR522]